MEQLNINYKNAFLSHLLNQHNNKQLVHEKFDSIYKINQCLYNNGNLIWVYFDLETANDAKTLTSNFQKDIKKGTIIEIGAVCGQNEFQELCNPGHAIDNSQIHGITDNAVLNARCTKDVLYSFFQWCQNLKTSKNDIVILIGHNAANFDRVVINNHIQNFCMEKNMYDNILIADSLYVVKKEKLENGKLETIYKKLFGDEYVEKHRALDDTKDLERIIEYLMVKNNTVKLSAFNNYIYQFNFNSCF